MIEKLMMMDVQNAVKTRIQSETELDYFDEIPEQIATPGCFVEIVKKRPADTKTFFKEVFTVWIHVLSTDNLEQRFASIKELEECLATDIVWPQDVTLASQRYRGMRMEKTDEIPDRHPILRYDFGLAYGLKEK